MARSKQNPYAGAKFTLASGAEITDLRLGKSKEAAVASNGEINAHSNKELLGKITEMITASSRGEVVRAVPEKDRRMHR